MVTALVRLSDQDGLLGGLSPIRRRPFLQPHGWRKGTGRRPPLLARIAGSVRRVLASYIRPTYLLNLGQAPASPSASSSLLPTFSVSPKPPIEMPKRRDAPSAA